MVKKTTVCVGTVGAGYAAYLHGNGYEQICQDYHEMLLDPDIDVVDIVTPRCSISK